MDWSKDFIGKAALEKVKAEGAKRALLGFRTEDLPAIEPGAPVEKAGQTVGTVTMFTESLSLGGGIGYALVNLDQAKEGDAVTVAGVETQLVSRVFYDPEDSRL